MNNFQDLQDKVGEWSDEEFGERSTVEGLFAHLKEEVRHLGNDFFDAMSYADVLILVLALARKHQYTMDELYKAVEAKLNINKMREWEQPDEQGIIRHK
jgi:hypothetical protein